MGGQMNRFRAGLASLCLAGEVTAGAPAFSATLQDHYQRYVQHVTNREFLEAIPEGRLILNVTEKALGRTNVQTGVMALNMAILYSGLGWYDRAAPYFEEAQNILTATTEPSDPRRQQLTSAIASFDLDRGEYRKAADLFKQLLEQSDSNKQSPDARVSLLTSYGRSLRFVDPDLSIKIFDEARDVATKAFGKKDAKVGSILLDVAETEASRGNLEDAKSIYEDVIGHFGGAKARPTWLGYAARQEKAFLMYRAGDAEKVVHYLGDAFIGRFQFEANRIDMYPPYNCATDADRRLAPDKWVYVAFGVDSDGRVIGARILAANPPLVNDRAVLRAMHDWRLPPDDVDDLMSGIAAMRMYIGCVPESQENAASNPGDEDSPVLENAVRRALSEVSAPPDLQSARAKYTDLAVARKEQAALDLVEDALGEALDASDKPDLRIAAAWYDYGMLLALFDHRAEARTAAKHALDAFEKIYPKNDARLLPVLALLTNVSGAKGSEPYASRAALIAKAEGRKDDLRVADVLYAYAAAGGFTQGSDVERSFDIYASNPKTDPKEFAARLLNYAKSQFRGGRNNAIDALKRILSGPGATLPPTNPYVRAAHYYLAAMLGDEGASPEQVAEANKHADAVGFEEDPAFSALVQSMPVLHMGHGRYPETARKLLLEGEATVSYRISDKGAVEDATVIESFPLSVFDDAALDAIKQWKYPPIMGEIPLPRKVIRFRFKFQR